MKNYPISIIVQNPYGKEYELTTSVSVGYTNPDHSTWDSDIDYYGGYEVDVDYDSIVALDLDDIEAPEPTAIEEVMGALNLDWEDIGEKFMMEGISLYEKDKDREYYD